MKKQVYNPYLPVDVYIPDGEPHVFGDRLYIFGSHDKEGGDTFCMLDYEVWSAPVTKLSDWRCEGTVYHARQDPDYGEDYKYMYAPDVIRGSDGRYYLYYAMSGGKHFTGRLHVAVADFPAGKYQYYGCIRNPDGSPFTENITFDPAMFYDVGKFFLYYGWALAVAKEKAGQIQKQPTMSEELIAVQTMMFEKTREEVLSDPQGVMGAFVAEIGEDMLTVQTKPKRIVPGQFFSCGSGYEGHAFFEASSMRKIGGKYYFIYSSEVSHELCYAVSDFPDREFCYGGVIVSNGDVGYQGRREEDKLAITGNNHGSIEKINGEWYVFYHRQTHKTAYSRQGCAEKICILPDGSIPQVPMTSCGLNGAPLVADGCYPAVIACNLTNGKMPSTVNDGNPEDIPFISSRDGEQMIADITEGTRIGYKFFEFAGSAELVLTVRGMGSGSFAVFVKGKYAGEIAVQESGEWMQYRTKVDVNGVGTLELCFSGEGRFELLQFAFEDPQGMGRGC